MRRVTVVGHDATPASSHALARARSLGCGLVVLTETGAAVPEALPAGTVVRQVRRVAPDVVFDLAAEIGAQTMVLSEAMANPVVALRPAMLAARRGLRAHGGSHACLLIVRAAAEPPDPSRAHRYRRLLVGVDASPGAAVAAIAAGRIARLGSATMDVAAIERRRDTALRELVERLAVTEPTPPSTALRRRQQPRTPHLQSALDALAAASVPAHIEFRVGDPTDVLVRASRRDTHDLLVTSTIGVNDSGRQGHVAHVTRRLLRLSRVDNLVVFDAFTLGLTGSDGAEGTVRDASECLATARDSAYGEAAATLPDTDAESP